MREEFEGRREPATRELRRRLQEAKDAIADENREEAIEKQRKRGS